MTPDDAVVEAVVHAVCPLIKPWMDEAEALTYDSCDCAGYSVVEGHGDCVTACRAVMEDVAKAAILAYRRAMRERGVVEVKLPLGADYSDEITDEQLSLIQETSAGKKM